MTRLDEIRDSEVAVPLPASHDAGLYYIGRIHTPWTSRLETPRQGRDDGPICRIELFPPWDAALAGIAEYARLEVLYWLHLSRRDLVLQDMKRNAHPKGTFALRSPARPNPIATQIVEFVGLESGTVLVRGLDCIDNTPLLDLKPARDLFIPPAPPQAGDFQTG